VRPGAVNLNPDPYARIAYANRDTTFKLEEKGVSLQGDIDFGFGKLTSVSAFRSWVNLRGQDSDFTAADIYYRPADQYTDQFDSLSQELRLAGEHGKLNWLVGLFYANEQYRGEAPLIYGNDYYAFWAGRVLSGAPALIGASQANTFTPGGGGRDYYTQDDDTFALFTNNTFAITPAWDLTVGLRYTIDKKDRNRPSAPRPDPATARAAPTPPSPAPSARRRPNVWSPECACPGRPRPSTRRAASRSARRGNGRARPRPATASPRE
jgi:outer membrane receptor protein involved in Fe transport